MAIMMMNDAGKRWRAGEGFLEFVCKPNGPVFLKSTIIRKPLSWCNAETRKNNTQFAPHPRRHSSQDYISNSRGLSVCVCVFPDLYPTEAGKFTRGQESDLFRNDKGRSFSLQPLSAPYMSSPRWLLLLISSHLIIVTNIISLPNGLGNYTHRIKAEMVFLLAPLINAGDQQFFKESESKNKSSTGSNQHSHS